MPPLESTHDLEHLTRALALATETVGLASPNPHVGCVLADAAGRILGEGAHRYELRDHAEIVTLKAAAAAGKTVCGSTAYVTLEPCAHQGRTGPCADALIAAGIARCVVACIDPNPLTRNKGLAKLRDAGVTVDVLNRTHPVAIAARRLNDAFACSMQHQRPFVTLKAAVSLDGYLAPPPTARSAATPHWLTGPAARADVQHLRHSADAILTGIGTVFADDPLLSDRSGDAADGQPRSRPLLRIVLDSHLRTPLTSKLVQSAHDDLLIVCDEAAATARELPLRERGAEVLRVPSQDDHLDLTAVLVELHRRNLLSVLLEAGSAVNVSFLAAGLVDRVVLYFSETELGQGAVPFAAGQPSPYALQQQLTDVTRVEFPHNATTDVRIAGYLRDPWAPTATTIKPAATK